MQSAALKLWSQDMVGNFAKAQQTVYARARDNGLAALGQWRRLQSAASLAASENAGLVPAFFLHLVGAASAAIPTPRHRRTAPHV